MVKKRIFFRWFSKIINWKSSWKYTKHWAGGMGVGKRFFHIMTIWQMNNKQKGGGVPATGLVGWGKLCGPNNEQRVEHRNLIIYSMGKCWTNEIV